MAPSTLQTRLRFSRIDAPTIALAPPQRRFPDARTGPHARRLLPPCRRRRRSAAFFFKAGGGCVTPRTCSFATGKSFSPAALPTNMNNRCARSAIPITGSGCRRRLYIGGYNFTVTGLCEAIAARLPLNRFDRDAAKKRASLQSAVIRAAILDMDLSQSVYLEEMEQARRSDLQKVAADLQLSIAETAASVTTTAEALQQNAHRMDESATNDGCASPGGRRRRRADGGQCERGFGRHDRVELFGQRDRPADAAFASNRRILGASREKIGRDDRPSGPGGRTDRRICRHDQRHSREDQHAGAQRHHRGGARWRSRAGFRRGGERGQGAGRTDRQGHGGNRGKNLGDSGVNPSFSPKTST